MIRPTRANAICGAPIAVTGIGCRFPGGVTSADDFWDMLARGTDTISEVPKDRWDHRRFYHPSTDKPGKCSWRWGGFLSEDVYGFDPLFFGISPRDADAMDPQQRYVLQVAYEALEDAGLPLDRLRGSDTGVFMGGFTLDSALTQLSPDNLHLADGSTATSCTLAILSNRLSHAFDFHGPSFTVDTACSASLTAIHLAVRSLRAGDCGVALAGGVTIMTRPEYPISMSNGGFLSKHGRCMAFDERAEGYTRGEGCGIVVLKTLDQAIADGDRIYSVIRNTGINQDGATKGIAAPNGDAQQALIERVYREAGLTPDDMQVVEAHGTGTQAGDTTECGALARVLEGSARDVDVVVGSVKTNIGHLEAAAGVAGLIKASLMAQRGEVLPSIHFERPNPKIPFDEIPLRVPTAVEPWPTDDPVRRVSVNSFGYGGTNAHAVVESPPEDRPAPADERGRDEDAVFFLPVSAQDERALRELAGRYAERLGDLRSERDFHDLLHSAAERRSLLRHRACFFGATPADIAHELRVFAAGEESASAGYANTPTSEPASLVQVFTGMGPQWHGMGQELYATQPAFRNFVDHADEIFGGIASWSILAEMQKGETESRMAETGIAQPANFVLQAGLAALYAEYGIEADVVVGHSVGEVAAAYVSGALTLEDALKVSFHRSRLQASCAGMGGMLAVGLSEAEVIDLLQRYEGVEIAALNGPASGTLAGPVERLQAVATELEGRGVFHRMLAVEVPYHSAAMDSIRDELLCTLADIDPKSPTKPLYSTVSGRLLDERLMDADYWWSNVREPVRFAESISHIAEERLAPVFLEVGPHPVLGTSIRQTLQAGDLPVRHAYALHRKKPEVSSVHRSIAEIATLGRDTSWDRVNGISGQFTDLPRYPWTLTRHLRMSDRAAQHLLGREGHALLSESVAAPDPTWEVEVNAQLLPYLPDHVVDGSVVVPGATYVEAGLAIAREEGHPGAITLQDLVFHNVMVEEESVQTRMRSSLESESGRFTVHSRTVGDDDSWRVHATGRIIEEGLDDLGTVDFDPDRGAEMSTDRHYERLNECGLTYGDSFRTVRSLRRLGPDHVVVGLQQRGVDDDPAHEYYLAHPTMLDGAFQSLLSATEPSIDAPESDRPFVPVSIGRVQLVEALPTSCFASIRVTSRSDDALTGDIELFDEEGRVLARMMGVRCQALAATSEADPLDGLFHEMRWVPTSAGDVALEDRRWAFVGDPELVRVCTEGLGLDPSEVRAIEHLDADTDPCTVLADPTPTDIVYLGAFEPAPELNANEVLTRLSSVAGAARRLVVGADTGDIRLHTITLAAHAVVDGDPNHNLVGATLNAFGTVIENEHPNVRCFFTDVADRSDLGRHVTEILASQDAPRDRAFRDGRWFRHELAATHLPEVEPERTRGDLHATCIGVRLAESGNVESLGLEERELPEPGAHEVQIQTHAASLNFKDLLKVYGQLDDSVVQDTYCGETIGIEASGVVTRVGAEVTSLEVGDEVVGILPDAFRSYANIRADYVIRKPTSLDHTEAAALLSYMTAWYGLVTKAGLTSDDRVLIHNATGGVGSAALQIARWRGAEIFATAGTPEKRAWLRAQGVEHVYDSRTLAFAEQIRSDTEGEGVDVVLSAVAGEALTQSFELLAPFGRFVEIGKKNIAENRDLPMRAFQDNLTFFAIDIDRMLALQPRAARRLLVEVANAFKLGCFRPIPVTVFPADEASDAFQLMARAQHVGKVALRFAGVEGEYVPSLPNTGTVRSDGSYLVTGGTSGFGLEVAKWLASEGAGRLVLVSRSGETEACRAAMAELTAHGAQVDVRAVDVGVEAGVTDLIASLEEHEIPLRGVFHGAVVLEDAFLHQLEQESLARVLRPKLMAAVHLHRATVNCDLDHFFCFSSISALIGNPGQSSYVIANSFLDALCRHRRNIGLAGMSVNWGAITDVGILSRKTEVAGAFQRLGVDGITPAESFEILKRVVSHDVAQIGAFRVEWGKVIETMPHLSDPATRFSGIQASDLSEGEGGVSREARERLRSDCPEGVELDAHVLDFVLDRISGLLKIPPKQLDPSMRITDMGVDSLVAVELSVDLRRGSGVDFSTVQLLSGPTPRRLSGEILSGLGV